MHTTTVTIEPAAARRLRGVARRDVHAHCAADRAALLYARPAPCEPARPMADCADCPRRRSATPDPQAWRSREVRIDGSAVTPLGATECVVRTRDLLHHWAWKGLP